MPRRSRVSLEDIADLRTLSWAFWRAGRGKRDRREVREFEADIDRRLTRLGDEIRSGRPRVGDYVSFVVRDPKRRIIHAPRFRERVLHHAMMKHMEPVFERSLVDDTFACRFGKGTLRAVHRAQEHLRRYPWFVKIDVRRFFDSVDHEVLLRMLRHRFKDPRVIDLARTVVASYRTDVGKGLPIGALTSQHFANSYLASTDRFLIERLKVRGMVRYMDDILWWCDSRAEARASLRTMHEFLGDEAALEIKPSTQVQRSTSGVTFCGFRVFRGALRLTRRRRSRYVAARAFWETAYGDGRIDAQDLQHGYDSALAITRHADASSWRREQLRRVPAPDV